MRPAELGLRRVPLVETPVRAVVVRADGPREVVAERLVEDGRPAAVGDLETVTLIYLLSNLRLTRMQ